MMNGQSSVRTNPSGASQKLEQADRQHRLKREHQKKSERNQGRNRPKNFNQFVTH
jgi:hypothetical protein